ncbi:MAG TPA: helix-turn-helix domain-containing protein [Flavobacteriales bacterium]|nr:helix-turn-helix domain-containing protein [Flavobacteriales bacterium]
MDNKRTTALRERIAKAMKKKKMTRYRVAERTGLRQSTVETALNGSGGMLYETAEAIREAVDNYDGA